MLFFASTKAPPCRLVKLHLCEQQPTRDPGRGSRQNRIRALPWQRSVYLPGAMTPPIDQCTNLLSKHLFTFGRQPTVRVCVFVCARAQVDRIGQSEKLCVTEFRARAPSVCGSDRTSDPIFPNLCFLTEFSFCSGSGVPWFELQRQLFWPDHVVRIDNPHPVSTSVATCLSVRGLEEWAHLGLVVSGCLPS